MKPIKYYSTCPKCGDQIVVDGEVPTDPLLIAPEIKGEIFPTGSIYVYTITSEMLKDFITKKAREYSASIKVELVPRYCERKRRRENGPRHSFASLRIAFSKEAIESAGDFGWFSKITDGSDHVRVTSDIFNKFIKRYSYNRDDIQNWMNYKNLEELEDALGITEEYLQDLRYFCTPRKVKGDNGDDWIMFAAAAEKVIADMMIDAHSGKPIGRFEIHAVEPISKDVVQFVTYVHTNEQEIRTNENVRRMLAGEKGKKGK